MKKSLIALSLATLLITVVSFNSLKQTTPAEDMATVYIYRVGQFGAAAANWSIWTDDTKICKLSNNKFIKHQVKPGKHVYNAKVGGIGILKKETGIEIEAEAGKSYYIACNVKQSITRTRLELVEVTKSSADKQMAKMTIDNCREGIDEKE